MAINPPPPMKNPIKKALNDVNKRGLELQGFICSTKNNELLYLSYDNNGNATYVTRGVPAITIYERTGGRAIRELVTIAPADFFDHHEERKTTQAKHIKDTVKPKPSKQGLMQRLRKKLRGEK